MTKGVETDSKGHKHIKRDDEKWLFKDLYDIRKTIKNYINSMRPSEENKIEKSVKKDMSIAAIACAVSPKALQDEFIFRVEVMQAFAPSHPQQGCLYYKITDLENLKSIACIWDLESHAGGDRRVINFTKGCNIMIHDTQYLDEEYNSDKMIVQGFGHSTYTMAIENATQAGVATLICIHYSPTHSDKLLGKLEIEYEKHTNPKVVFATEGFEV